MGELVASLRSDALGRFAGRSSQPSALAGSGCRQDALVAPVHHRSDRPAKRAARVLRFRAVGQEQVSSILGFSDRSERWSTDAPLQLNGGCHG